MYVVGNPRTKKALKEMLEINLPIGIDKSYLFQPNSDLTGAVVPDNGTVYIEGPQYPEPHRWYAKGTMKDGKLVKIS
jgi:hypothetical protein